MAITDRVDFVHQNVQEGFQQRSNEKKLTKKYQIQ